jgi:sigma54-dependent transcription regulator
MLKCPFHTRFRAVMGGQLAEDTGLRAKRAWIGAVGSSEAIWVGIEVEKEVRVIRVEYELDDTGRFSESTSE